MPNECLRAELTPVTTILDDRSPAFVSKPSAPDPRVATDRARGLVDGLLLLCLLAMVAAKSIIPSAAVDEDLWWHVRSGDWMLSHHAVPLYDVFSTYTSGKPWIAYTWLFDVLSSRIYNTSGLHGILTFTVILILSFVAAVVALLSYRRPMRRAIALAGLVFAASATMVTPRPWLFTCVFFVVELYLLLRARSESRVVWLVPLPLLFLLWANLHIQFIYGLGTLGLFALERPLAALLKWHSERARLRPSAIWIVLVTSGLATLVNPYGWRLYFIVFQYATQTAPLQVVTEMQAMHFRSITDWALLFLACTALLSYAASGRKCALTLSLLTISLYLGFHTGRDGWFLAVIAAYVIADCGEPAEHDPGKVRLLQWTFALPIALGLTFAVLRSAGVSPGALQQAASKRFPDAASAFIEKKAMPGPLYNSYGWGGYLIWRLKDMPVSIDGRANLHGDDRLSRAVLTWMGRHDWSDDPELMKARTILLERDSALASILRADSRFRLQYEDEVASVFQPAGIAAIGPVSQR